MNSENKIVPQFDYTYYGNPRIDDTPQLRCPNCGENYTHHTTTHVFYRAREDAEHGQHVSAGGPETRITTDMDGNPSERRDGIVIEFWCEICASLFEMRIAQHKGATLIGMHVTGDAHHTDEKIRLIK